MGKEKVNIVGTWGKAFKHRESNSEEAAKYLNMEMTGFWAKG